MLRLTFQSIFKIQIWTATSEPTCPSIFLRQTVTELYANNPTVPRIRSCIAPIFMTNFFIFQPNISGISIFHLISPKYADMLPETQVAPACNAGHLPIVYYGLFKRGVWLPLIYKILQQPFSVQDCHLRFKYSPHKKVYIASKYRSSM